jgi:TonB family protein
VKATPTDGVVVYRDRNAVLQARKSRRLTESAQEDTTKASVQAATTNASLRNPLPLLPREADANLVGRVEPQYPKSAIEQHIQGGIVLDIDVNQSGAVQGVYPVSGHPLLTTAAIDAVRQWRFRPYLRDGKPMNFETRITLNFALP